MDSSLAQRRGRSWRRTHEDMLLPGLVQHDIVPGSRARGAVGRTDRPLIVDCLANQVDIAAEGADRARILDPVGITAREVKVAGEKIGVGNIARAGNETVGAYHSARPD